MNWCFQALAHPYFKGLAKIEREPSCQPITQMEFEFEKKRVTKGEIRDLIFNEILEYHPQLNGTERTNFLYPRFFGLFSTTCFFFSNVFFIRMSTLLLSPCHWSCSF
jgi:hypothetical protein